MTSSRWQEHSIQRGEQRLAFRIHGPDDAHPVLALHGWRDNAASFEALAPLLPDLRLIAVDMPGHGLSSWRNLDAGYYIWSYLDEVLAVAEAQGLERFSLLGHSMGGAIASLFAGAFPERIERLVLLDAVGPLATAPDDAPGQLRRALEQQRNLKTLRHHYADFAAAVQARADKGLGVDAAAILARRGVARNDKGYYWAQDPRLTKANPLSLSEDLAEAFIRRIESPTLLIAAPEYWVGERRAWFERRCAWYRQLERVELPGHHHQHLEGQVAAVAARVRAFLG